MAADRSRSLRTLLVAVLFLAGGASPAAFAAPLKQRLTFPQFQALVKQKVGEVRGLKGFWNASGDYVEQTTFTGGSFRGLLLWLFDNLQTHTVAQVTQMTPPSVAGLLLQGDADLDLLTPNRLVNKVEEHFPGWDVLDQKFFKRSVADRGSSLDRISANPWRISDPLNGLREFYDGRLVFHPVARMHLDGNTRVALALRYLRFAKEFDRAVQPDARSLELVRKIAAAATLPVNRREEIQDFSSVRYWVKKALSKIYKAYPGKPEVAVLRLRELGLPSGSPAEISETQARS